MADRRAGRAMPWHGKPLLENLKTTWRLWRERQHPTACATCAEIWGSSGAPTTFDDYHERYPPLAHGAKRHLTMPWSPGLTVAELARETGCSISGIQRAIANGQLLVKRIGGRSYITRTDATRWRARRCPLGEAAQSWIAYDTARKRFGFNVSELDDLVGKGRLKTRVGTHGAARGVRYVSQHQCAQLRETLGFGEAEAARKVGVSIVRLRELLRGVNWRAADGIPLTTVQAIIKRQKSRVGYNIEDAAKTLRVSVAWIRDRIRDGTVRVQRAPWDARRLYLTAPMVERLRTVRGKSAEPSRPSKAWLRLSEAAQVAGVSTSTIINWSRKERSFRAGRRRWRREYRYSRAITRARARRYWAAVRFHRATPPSWLAAERGCRAGRDT